VPVMLLAFGMILHLAFLQTESLPLAHRAAE
jgi:hypothetical protein